MSTNTSEATIKQYMHTNKHVAGAREAPCVRPAGHAVHLQSQKKRTSECNRQHLIKMRGHRV